MTVTWKMLKYAARGGTTGIPCKGGAMVWVSVTHTPGAAADFYEIRVTSDAMPKKGDVIDTVADFLKLLDMARDVEYRIANLLRKVDHIGAGYAIAFTVDDRNNVKSI